MYHVLHGSVPSPGIRGRLRPRGVQGALPPGRGVWGGFAPPGQQGGLGGCRPPKGGGGAQRGPTGVPPPGVFFSSRTPSRIDVGVLGRAQTGNVQQSKYHFNPIARNQRISLSFGFDFRSNTPRGSADFLDEAPVKFSENIFGSI